MGPQITSTGELELQEEFASFVREQEFPCVGAKSALAHGTLKTVVCWSIESGWDDVRIHRELLEWAFRYREEPGLFRSIAFIFASPGPLSEERFERAMWERIQSLADKDAWLKQPYDPRVSSDPQDPHFSLSFGGEGFFVVGMHPNASRPARRFSHPVLVFNLHDQFEQLRDQGKYETIRKTILARDEKLAGSVNPMLARHGDASEAAQYSGRLVGDGWRCPFSDPRLDKPEPLEAAE
ncbi:guanitoxin biosynthesis heme-dependent pre-guanitoxin N-hydroxylase GntA [Novosphingobium sp. M1R2S20]|uniref:Guanitoxin biosynthesis heme-dependent pre-guanitoxin N-hydroxylase GntA n=1 Tax=Novosphingobium rhizovicinum TaxID=3228928 RepID=A0ABV3R887_9SPHN